MRFRRTVTVPDPRQVEALLRESEALDRQLRRMVRRLETFTDQLMVTTASDPPEGGGVDAAT